VQSFRQKNQFKCLANLLGKTLKMLFRSYAVLIDSCITLSFKYCGTFDLILKGLFVPSSMYIKTSLLKEPETV
jgi:hypothetical protein